MDYSALYSNVEERIDPFECKISGTIPKWLNGTLLRNGPGKFSIGPDKYQNVSDGMALIQKYTIKDGRVWYSSKFLRSSAYERNMSAQRIVVSEFGTRAMPDPCKNLFSMYLSQYLPFVDFSDNALVNFLRLGDSVYAATEIPKYTKVDPKTLQINSTMTFDNYLAVNTATAHPHYDMATGDVYNIGTSIGKYRIVKMRPPETATTRPAHVNEKLPLEVVASIPMRDWTKPSYYHSFGMSANHFLLAEMPLRLNAVSLMTSGFRDRTVLDSLEWSEQLETTLHVVSRETRQLLKHRYSANGCFIFHHANTFEQDGCLVADMCVYPDATIVTRLTLDNLAKGKVQSEKEVVQFLRLIIPLEIKDTTTEDDLLGGFTGYRPPECTAKKKQNGEIFCSPGRLTEIPMDFPRYNYERCNGRPYRYCYGSALQYREREALVKVNVSNGSHQTWYREHWGQVAGEPVFVAAPNAAEEDQGLILAPIMNAKDDDRPFLLILDASTFGEIARVEIPDNIPFGFHEIFLSDV